MSKYKVGDKFVVEIEETADCNCEPWRLYKMKGFNSLVFDDNGLDKLERLQNAGHTMSPEEAWEIARKLFAEYTNRELDEIFGKGWSYPDLMKMTPQEAKAKIEEHGNPKEFQTGDVVRGINSPGTKVLVTRRYKDGTCEGINASGSTYFGMDERYWKKTGLHYDIENILKKFKEES